MKENEYFANRYQEVNVSTATPVHLIVMLYDEAVRSLEAALECMERRDISGRARAVNKCSAVISELQSSLNLKEGGEIASSLNRLYDYMKSTLLRASVEQNPRLVTEVRGLLKNLGSAWRQIDSGVTTVKPVEPSADAVQNAGLPQKPPVVESEYIGSLNISA